VTRTLAALPSAQEVDRVAIGELPAFVAQCAGILAHASMRLRSLAVEQGDDVEAFDAEEAARRIKVSTDTLREHGATWGVALVVTRDRQGRATRVVYPRARLRAFLNGRPTATKRAAA
jgi:hypothetical protein